MDPLKSPQREFARIVGKPIDGPSLEQVVKSVQGTILVVCSDQTRADGKDRILPWLLDKLNEYGIPDSRIRLLVALGSHKPIDDARIMDIVGPAASRVRFDQHDVCGQMLDKGRTTFGTPVRVNAILGKVGLVIPVSSVVHHYFAGYGGGRKTIVPGLASLETIVANHSLVWKDAHGSGGRHSMAKSGILDGNPVADDLMEAARLALRDVPHYSIVTVLSTDNEFGFFATGDIESSHRAAAAFADRYFMAPIDREADVVIASAGGRPKDLNVIQAHKGLDNAVRALKPGGTALYVMGCADGLGSPVVAEFAPLGLEEIRKRLAENYAVYGQTTHSLKEKTRDFRVVAVSELDPEKLGQLGFIPAGGIDEAMGMIGKELESAERVYVLPRADVTVPRKQAD
jgi:nickel-dependent lactate racemase